MEKKNKRKEINILNNIYTLQASKPCYINMDNIASIMKSYDNGQWKLEFCIAGGECERLKFYSKSENDIDRVVNDIIDFCKNNKIQIIIRKNKSDCNPNEKDGHILIIFTKYNVYINLSTGKIIDTDNREWAVRKNDELYFENYENDEDILEDKNLKSILNINLELMTKITKLEEKLSNLKINVISNSTSGEQPEIKITTEQDNKKISNTIRIPSQEEMKEEIANNRNSFLRRS